LAFELALGYKAENANELIAEIRKGLLIFPAKMKGNKGYGQLYEVLMRISGLNGKTAEVATAWIDDVSNGELRLISAYVK
jgi:hypothetical protein